MTHGQGYGRGYGGGWGSGEGNGSGTGYGNGYGNGYGSGYGDGSGYGSGSEEERKKIELNILKNIPDIDLPLYLDIWEFPETKQALAERFK